MEPVEDSGSDTASRYNFQHQCAARHCFAMLNDATLTSIICEWHVDYILTYKNGETHLVSVKHREPALGPWPLGELWGKGGLNTLYERWQVSPEVKCRLVTNGFMKTGKGNARDFCDALSAQNVDDYVEICSEKLKCTAEIAKQFLLALRIEFGIADRVTLRADQIINTVEPALRNSDLADINPARAWDAVVGLVATKSRDQDNRQFSSIDFAQPDALDTATLTSNKVLRRTIHRVDVVATITEPSSPTRAPDAPTNLWVREPSSVFIGRNQELEEIESFLAAESTSSPALAVLGMSGVGKSEVVAQYAWQHKDSFEFSWWIRAESWESMISDLTLLADELGIPAPDSESGIRRIKQFFREKHGLILLDNAPADPRIIGFLPKTAATRFLVSSVDQGWAAHLTAVQLAPLSKDDAGLLLSELLQEHSTDELVPLNEALKGLPLAIRQAAGYIKTSNISLAKYSAMVQARAKDLMRRSAPLEHIGLSAAMSITLETLRDKYPDALKVLHALSYLSPHFFPSALFLMTPTLDPESPEDQSSNLRFEVDESAAAELEGISPEAVSLLEKLKDELSLSDAIGDLRRFSIADCRSDDVAIHALTQGIVRQSLDHAEANSGIEVATALLNKVAILPALDSKYWPHYRYMMPHFEALIDHLETRDVLPASRLMFYGAIAMHASARGGIELCLVNAKKAVTAVELLDDASIQTAIFARTLLVDALTRADRWDEALRTADEGIKLSASSSVDTTSIAVLHSKKAAVLHLQGKLKEALKEFDKIEEAIESIENSETTVIRRVIKANRANLRRESGDARGAAADYEAMIADYPSDGTKNGLATLYSNLCLAYLDATDYTRALTAAQEALEIDFADSDGIHLDAARDWNNAGLALLELQNTGEAKKAFMASLEVHERLGGERTTLYLIALMNLGRAQLAEGDAEASRKTLEKTLRIQEEIIGADHREVAATLANLAVAYTVLGLFGNASKAAFRALRIDVGVYGEGHPELLADYNNLAGALMLAGNPKAALKWLNKALEIAKETFGAESFRVAQCLEKVAVCTYQIGERKAAISLMSETIRIYTATAGHGSDQSLICRELHKQMLEGRNALVIGGADAP
ncbi:dsDNA nuclease domain-containing protein [Streptomyces sp. NPDC003023]|uniref:dsDNA nuclease domain-containing protein n=1 Tax=Streptomyces sp. NPDC003023 TaxID=3364675 RepID=UPI00368E9409